jgi:ribosomal protein S18 acetylase RimI-like enzyme
LSSYRFCRTDDMPLLVDAYQRAFAPHFAPPPELDLPAFKAWIRELDLWCSSCMVALDGSTPIAVVLGAKRPKQTLVLAVGVHPEYTRRGHGRHMLTSLSSKLAILGPPEIVAEVPAEDARANAFFAACEYAAGPRFRDFALEVAAGPVLSAAAVVPITLDELVANDAVATSPPRPWARAHESLLRRQDGLQGLALASPDRIEAWILWREGPAAREVMAMGAADAPGASGRGQDLLGLLVRHFASLAPTRVLFQRVHEDEVPWAWLEAWGFQGGREHRRYTTTARAA